MVPLIHLNYSSPTLMLIMVGNPDNGRSTGGYAVIIGGGAGCKLEQSSPICCFSVNHWSWIHCCCWSREGNYLDTKSPHWIWLQYYLSITSSHWQQLCSHCCEESWTSWLYEALGLVIPLVAWYCWGRKYFSHSYSNHHSGCWYFHKTSEDWCLSWSTWFTKVEMCYIKGECYCTISHLTSFWSLLLLLMRCMHHCLLLLTHTCTQSRVRIQHSSVAYFGL